ncbi:PREDICTED: uncharacterized protein LOC105450242 [Wasmannia auropunctata]|uniref:uncharacterized protein LOC105450242 n=1 Tax=Wasmannia auropunctata TaxID=64793 RepID=UPI0005ED8AE6|nr:PREDICTED: uncharacterized protein LOC105450242 [Wasmannia auropunctata]
MNRSEMELHNDSAKRQSYCGFWHNLPERLSGAIEYFFYRLGVRIAQNPFKWMRGCLVVTLICCLGLFRFRQEKNIVKLWIPPDSDFAKATEWLMSHYLETLRIQTFILTGDNVLEQQTLIRLNEITKQIISSQTPIENISWTDVCMKVPIISGAMSRFKRQSSLLGDDLYDDNLASKNNQTFEPAVHIDSNMYCSIIESLRKGCLLISILDIWNFDSAKIAKDSTEEIITKINTIKVSPTLGYTLNFSELLGNVTLDERNRIIAATTIRTNLIVHVSFFNVDMNKIGNMAGTTDLVREFNDYCKTEGIKHLTITTGLPRANGQVERLNRTIISVLSKLTIEDPTKWYRHVGKLQQILNSTHNHSINSTPFDLLFGVKMRERTDLELKEIIELEFQSQFEEERNQSRIKAKEQTLKVQSENCKTYNLRRKTALKHNIGDLVAVKRTQLGPERKLRAKYLGPYRIEKTKPNDIYDVSRVGEHEGPAHTSTCAEYIKPWNTILPVLRSFCIYAAVAIFVTLLFQITFFTACFALDAKRIEQKRNGTLPCIVHENFTSKSSDVSSTFSWKLINFLYSRILLTTPGKIIIVLITLLMMSTSIVGLLQLQQWFDPKWLLPKDSYLYQYTAVRDEAFPNQGYEAFVIMGDDIDYSFEFSKIISMTERLQNASFVQSLEPWPIDFAKFVSMYYATDLRTTKISDNKFHRYLSQFLFSRDGAKYQRNFFFKTKLRCGRNTPQIAVASIEFNFKRLERPYECVSAMDNSIFLTNEAQIHGYVTVWCKMFAYWLSDKLIGKELMRNIILALICVMGTTAILIAEMQTCFWILLCVLLTLLNISGFMYFWGQTINIVSSIGLQLAIGLSVDYAAHVAHAFLKAESREDDDNPRRTRALIAVRHIGAAVIHGASTTLIAILMISFSSSFVYIVYFRIFFMVMLFGIWNGLIVLPVVLSSIGPQSLRITPPSQPMSEKFIAAINDEN